jgi:hypothetical protein
VSKANAVSRKSNLKFTEKLEGSNKSILSGEEDKRSHVSSIISGEDSELNSSEEYFIVKPSTLYVNNY